MKKYSVILFDIDDTIFDFAKCEKEALCEALELSGITPDGEMIDAYQKINYALWKALERGEIEREELMTRRFDELIKSYSLSADAFKLANDYVFCLGHKIHYVDGAKELLLSLCGKVRMYIVTNGLEAVQSRRYELACLGDIFDGMFISEVIGANKPSAEFFEYVAAHIDGFDKSKTLIVGDSITSDIAGGIAFGIDTCWYSPNGASTSLEPTYVVDSMSKVLSIALAEDSDE